jgi:hypothetical protein
MCRAKAVNSYQCVLFLPALHCKEIRVYVFPEKELRALSSNFHIYVSVSDLFIPTFDPPIFMQQNRQIDQGNIYINRSQKHKCRDRDYSSADPFLRIFVSNFRSCAFAVCPWQTL